MRGPVGLDDIERDPSSTNASTDDGSPPRSGCGVRERNPNPAASGTDLRPRTCSLPSDRVVPRNFRPLGTCFVAHSGGRREASATNLRSQPAGQAEQRGGCKNPQRIQARHVSNGSRGRHVIATATTLCTATDATTMALARDQADRDRQQSGLDRMIRHGASLKRSQACRRRKRRTRRSDRTSPAVATSAPSKTGYVVADQGDDDDVRARRRPGRSRICRRTAARSSSARPRPPRGAFPAPPNWRRRSQTATSARNSRPGSSSVPLSSFIAAPPGDCNAQPAPAPRAPSRAASASRRPPRRSRARSAAPGRADP